MKKRIELVFFGIRGLRSFFLHYPKEVELSFMNNFERKNIKLLNLVDLGLSGRTVLKIIENCDDHYVSELDIRNILGDTPTCKKMIQQFYLLDQSYYSVYCLLKFGINMIVIEKIKNSFGTLNFLSNNLRLLEDLHLQGKTEERICFALKSLNLNCITDLNKELLDEIQHNEPCFNNYLKEIMLNKYPLLSVAEYDRAIDTLIKENKIIHSIDGLRIRKCLLKEYLSKFQDSGIEVVTWRLQGETLQSIAHKKGVSRQRIQQMVQKRIKKFPIFYNEEKYYKIMNLYDLSNIEFKLVGLDDDFLIEYVRVKYKLSPSKNALDYIADFNISGTEQAREILKSNKLVLIDGDLVQEDFIQLMKKYVNKMNIYSFSLGEIKDNYNKFLYEHYVENKELFISDSDDMILKNRKLDNSVFFLAIGEQRFYVYRPDSLSFDFEEALDSFLSEFYGFF